MKGWHNIGRIQAKRRLSAGERELARMVFADALQLDCIWVVSSAWVWRGYAISPNGHVYFHPDQYVDDFSVQPLSEQAWLIHELTHVWQYQQGVLVWLRAAFNRRYHYGEQPTQAWAHYGVEQQAQIVQDYFVRRMQGKSCEAWQNCLPFA